MRQPSNKALAVLALLRELGETTCKRLGEEMMERTPCPACGGTGEGDCSWYGCCKCYGRGRVLFSYSDAYQALQQLSKHGLVSRRRLVNEWGDETPSLVWRAAAVETDPADELEALYLAPSAEVDS